MSRGKLFIISAPSGAGKTTLAKQLVSEMEDTVLAVSHTTRTRRTGEAHGVDYYFVDREVFEDMVSAGQFIEYAEVFGNLYGTSRSELDKLLAAGQNVLLDIDWQGARKVRQQMPLVRSIFILPPSREELERRLRARAQDSDTVISSRMQEAEDEISHRGEYNYTVVNDDLDLALKDLKCILSGHIEGLRKATINI